MEPIFQIARAVLGGGLHERAAEVAQDEEREFVVGEAEFGAVSHQQFAQGSLQCGGVIRLGFLIAWKVARKNADERRVCAVGPGNVISRGGGFRVCFWGMTRLHLRKSILTAILLVGTVASFWLDWRENHLFIPHWHPHAKFHGGLFLFTLAGISATGLWVLWRKSAEPEVAVRMVALLALAYWTPLLYVNALVPGSSLWRVNRGTSRSGGGMFIISM
jgi:hypothetical protein